MFKRYYIFKQDFSIKEAISDIFQTWSGHAWVEIDDLILDLSIFRTIYSDKFTKLYKTDLIELFGAGRGCLCATSGEMNKLGLNYIAIDELEDSIATSIISGYLQHPF